jgi:hypothetical protein
MNVQGLDIWKLLVFVGLKWHLEGSSRYLFGNLGFCKMIIFTKWHKRIFSLGLLAIIMCKESIKSENEFIVLEISKFCILCVYHLSSNALELQKRKRMRTHPSFLSFFLNPKIKKNTSKRTHTWKWDCLLG